MWLDYTDRRVAKSVGNQNYSKGLLISHIPLFHGCYWDGIGSIHSHFATASWLGPIHVSVKFYTAVSTPKMQSTPQNTRRPQLETRKYLSLFEQQDGPVFSGHIQLPQEQIAVTQHRLWRKSERIERFGRFQ